MAPSASNILPAGDLAPARARPSAGAAPGDAEIAREVLNGRTERFEVLVHRYEAAIYRHAWRILRRREDAEDVTQEAFARAFSRLDTYDPGRPFRPWLYRIATNLAYSALRKPRPVTSLDDPECADSGLARDSALDPRRQVEQTLRAEQVGRAIERLSEPMRALISLRYHEELPIEDIARITCRRPGAVKVALHRARLKLRELVFGDRKTT